MKKKYLILAVIITVGIAGLTGGALLKFFSPHDNHSQHTWTNEDGDTYVDTYTKSNIHLIYRQYYKNSPQHEYAEGPFAYREGSNEPKQHGQWKNFGFVDYPVCKYAEFYEWFWYGDKITEEQWILRTK